MKVLVTGAGGFVGLNLLEVLLRQGHEVISLNNRALPPYVNAHLQTLGGDLQEVVGDVRDRILLRDLLHTKAPQAIVHAAAITPGRNATGTITERAFDVNTTSTAVILQEAATAGVTRFVYPSSTAVYGLAPFTAPVSEETPTQPHSIYAFTKLASERLVEEASQNLGIIGVSARITAVFGPWEHDTGARENMSPPLQVARAAVAGHPIVLPSAGERDWTSAEDIAKALAILVTGPSPQHRVYNLAAGQVWHSAQLANAMGAQVEFATPEKPATITFNDDLSRKRHPILADRFEAEFGFKFRSASVAIADYRDWIARHGLDAPFKH